MFGGCLVRVGVRVREWKRFSSSSEFEFENGGEIVRVGVRV